jgi:serine/threonine-protein kinase
VVHRDVSPSNLLLTSDGAVKVSDFGIARAQGRLVQTKAGSLKGKIPYMSPEQSRGKVVDLRTDVLSAGLVLWECLVGRRCYEAPSEADLLRKAAYADHQTFTQLGLDIPKPLEQIVERALQRDPAARFSSAGEMAQALETFHRQQHSRYTPDELGALVKESLEGFNPNQTSSGVPAISPGSNASSNSGPAQPISGPMDPHAQVTPAAIAMGTLPTLAHFNSGEPEHSTLEESADLPDEPSTTPSSPAIDLKSDPKLKPEPKPEPEVKKSNEEPHTFPSLKEYPVAEEAKKPKPAESGGRPVWLLMLIAMMASGGGFGLLAYLDHDPKTKDTIDPPQPSTPLEHPRGPTEASGPAAPTGGSEVKSSGSEDRPSHHNPRSPNSTGSNSSDRPSTATPGDGEVGYLTVRCDPKCNVQIEGSKTVFHAPVTKVPVPSGTHSIRLSSPEANLTMKAKVDIKAGLTTDRYFNLVMGR